MNMGCHTCIILFSPGSALCLVWYEAAAPKRPLPPSLMHTAGRFPLDRICKHQALDLILFELSFSHIDARTQMHEEYHHRQTPTQDSLQCLVHAASVQQQEFKLVIVSEIPLTGAHPCTRTLFMRRSAWNCLSSSANCRSVSCRSASRCTRPSRGLRPQSLCFLLQFQLSGCVCLTFSFESCMSPSARLNGRTFMAEPHVMERYRLPNFALLVTSDAHIEAFKDVRVAALYHQPPFNRP
jgi:hypothetical protein